MVDKDTINSSFVAVKETHLLNFIPNFYLHHYQQITLQDAWLLLKVHIRVTMYLNHYTGVPSIFILVIPRAYCHHTVASCLTKKRKNINIMVHQRRHAYIYIELTARAGGRPPKTSPRPPVLLHGPTSAPIKIIDMPFSHTILPTRLALGAFCCNPFEDLAETALAWHLLWSLSTMLKDLSPQWVMDWHLKLIWDRLALASEPEAPPWLLLTSETKWEAVTYAILRERETLFT